MQASPKQSAAQSDQLLRLPQVEALVGLRKSSLYDLIKRGEFPQPVKLSRRAVCWPESAVQGWIQSRIKASQKA
jgi:prophage regulatory protein